MTRHEQRAKLARFVEMAGLTNKRVLTPKQQADKYDLEVRLEAALQRKRVFASSGGYPGLEDTIDFLNQKLAFYS
jgi:hypothetical protein